MYERKSANVKKTTPSAPGNATSTEKTDIFNRFKFEKENNFQRKTTSNLDGKSSTE